MLRVDTIGADLLAGGGRDLLGLVGFGLARPAALDPAVPYFELDLPPVPAGAPPLFELWHCDGPVTRTVQDGFALSRGDGLLFGSISVPAGPDIEAASRSLYRRLLALVAEAGCPHLLRIYNYIPDITGMQQGEERYRRFNAGRRAVFEASGLHGASAPAASALGTAGTMLRLYVLASDRPGLRIENPRQVSAYDYPAQYGASPPIFARATIVDPDGDPLLLVSGTASIVSHESLHPGDPAAQTDEIIRNIEAILAECARHGLAPDGSAQLKIYLRPGIERNRVAARLGTLLDPDRAIWLQAEVCRPELLVEIETIIRLARIAHRPDQG